jgi:hypothetical protein
MVFALCSLSVIDLHLLSGGYFDPWHWKFFAIEQIAHIAPD